MHRFLLAAVAALALSPLTFASEPPAAMLPLEPPAARVETALSSVEAAVVPVWIGNRGGTCVGVEQDGEYTYFLTNSHITAGSPTATVHQGGRQHPATVVQHPNDDFAVLIVRAKLPTIPLAPNEPAAGEKVWLYGYDYRAQGKLSIKEGVAAEPSGLNFRSTLAPVSGDSGGAVVNVRGEVVCVNHGFSGSYERRGLQLGVRLATIKGFLKERFPRLAGAKPKAESLKANGDCKCPDCSSGCKGCDCPPKAKADPKKESPKEPKKVLWSYGGKLWLIPEGDDPAKYGLKGAVKYDPNCPSGNCPKANPLAPKYGK